MILISECFAIEKTTAENLRGFFSFFFSFVYFLCVEIPILKIVLSHKWVTSHVIL